MTAQAETNIEIIARDYHSLPASLHDTFVTHPSSCFFGRAAGDSMIDCGIFDKDILIINRAVTVKQFDIVVCNLNGSFVCKIIDLEGKRLLSANKDNPPYTVQPHDVFSLEGTVTSSIRMHKSSPVFNSI